MEERELPVGWTLTTFGEIAGKGQYGWTTKATTEGEIKLLRTTDITKGAINWASVPFCQDNPPDPEKYSLRPRDILISRAGSVGFAALIETVECPCVFASYLIRFILDEKAANPRFIIHFLKSPYYWQEIEEASAGIALSNVNASKLSSIYVPLPPLNEQRRIAAKLDTTLAAVDACRQRLDGVAAILKRFRQAVLAAATSGELTREWRGERGDFSHWQEKGLAELGEFGRGRSRHRPRNDPRLYGGDYPFIQTGDVANAKGDWLAAHSQTYSNFGLAQSRIWPSSTLCITIAANIADTALLEYPACFPDSVVGFVADRAQVEPLFAKWMIDSVADKLESFAPATAQKNINLSILDQVVFSVPPLQEQTEIISRAQKLFSLADQLEARLTAARKVVDRLTPALLAKAFRGELVPQDPNDEPASVLLERIRATRQAEAGAGKPSRRGRPKAAANPDQLPLDAAPVPSDPLPPDLLTQLLQECGALSERALLAASELEPEGFFTQLARELRLGSIRQSREEGQVLLEAVS